MLLNFALVAAFLVVWTALYFLVIRPKLVSYRYTAGIYAKLDAWETGFWSKAALWIKGLKVAIVGFVSSAAPIVVVFYDKIADFDWTKLLPDERARVIAGVVALLGVFGPVIMVWLHQGALAEAAATTPVASPPTAK